MFRLGVFLTIATIMSMTTLSLAGNSHHFESQTDSKVKDEFVYSSGETVSVLQCAAECARNQSCTSVSFNENGGTCLLSEYRIIGASNADMVTTEQAWTALSKKGGNGQQMPAGGCQTNYTMLGNGKYYRFLTEIHNYSTALTACSNRLAEPQYEKDFNLIRDQLLDNCADTFKNFWLGLILKNVFIWESQRPLHYNAFAPDSIYLHYKCVAFNKASDYYLGSQPCNSTGYAVCEDEE